MWEGWRLGWGRGRDGNREGWRWRWGVTWEGDKKGEMG